MAASEPPSSVSAPPIAPSRPVVGVSVLLRHDGRVLLVHRARAPYAGTWSLPGGRVEFGETLRAAARRELAEETSVEAEIGAFVATFDIIRPAEGDAPAQHFVLIVFAGRYLLGLPQAGDDAAAAAWFADSDIAALALTPETRSLLVKG